MSSRAVSGSFRGLCALGLTTWLASGLASGLANGLTGSTAWAEPQSPADLVPSSATFYAEVSRPAEVLRQILDNPLKAQLEQTEEYKRALEGKDLKKLESGIRLIERQIGGPWRPMLEKLLGGGIAFSYEATTQSGTLIARSSDSKALADVHQALLDFIELTDENAVQRKEFQGTTVYRVKELRYAIKDGWFLAANKDEGLKAILDNWSGAGGLSTNPEFVQARQQIPAGALAWAYGRLEKLREAKFSQEALAEKTNNPGAEILVGGILEALRSAPYATGALTVQGSRIQLQFATPRPREVSAWRQFYFAPAGSGSAPALLTPPGTLLSLSTYRDVADFWTKAEDRFDQNLGAKFAEADSKLSLFFSGKEFSTEILPLVMPRMQFVLTRQDFEGQTGPVPKIKLPAGAIVLQASDSEKLARPLKIAFQSIVGLGNLNAGQNGLPQLEVNTETKGNVTLTTAVYPADGVVDRDNVPIVYNFSPSLAVTGKHIILASSQRLAEQLAALAAQPAASANLPENTLLEVQGGVLRSVLVDNREQLITQRMLEKGTDRDEAEKNVDLVLRVMEHFQAASMRLVPDPSALRLEFSVELTGKP